MINRRKFLKNAGLGSALLATGAFPFQSFAAGNKTTLTILHTNDVHSRLDPFIDGKNAGLGGVAARANIINKIRQEAANILLLDAGDMLQGTPYFNFYKGEPEMKAMSMLGYDACTMGNHDFDAGMEGFANLIPLINFDVLTANYDFTNTPLEGKTKPYNIIRKAGLKIGMFGLGVSLKGLVSETMYGNTIYLDPLPIAQSISEQLKKVEKCDMVICLSHLGYDYGHEKISDKIIAAETEYIDLIIGGHTHTLLEKPTVVKNKIGADILVNQVGWGGIRLGRLDYVFEGKKNPKLINAQSVIVTK